MLTIIGSLYFLLTTGSVASAISLTERKSLMAVWRASYQWAYPYYLFGAATEAGLSVLAFVQRSSTHGLALLTLYPSCT